MRRRWKSMTSASARRTKTAKRKTKSKDSELEEAAAGGANLVVAVDEQELEEEVDMDDDNNDVAHLDADKHTASSISPSTSPPSSSSSNSVSTKTSPATSKPPSLVSSLSTEERQQQQQQQCGSDSRADPFAWLPPEVAGVHILAQLKPRDLFQALLVSTQWHALCEDDILWKFVCRRFLDIDEEELVAIKADIPSWKELCKAYGTNFLSCKLLDARQRVKLLEWLREEPVGEVGTIWELLYRATRDGFTVSDFHKKCCHKGPTVTVALSEKGNLFGGFNPDDWSMQQVGNSTRAFIFSLINPWDLPFRILPTKSSTSCSTSHSYGALWGTGYDLGILGHPVNKPRTAWCRLGAVYKPTEFNEAQVGGSFHFAIDGAPRDFSIVEVEVFRKRSAEIAEEREKEKEKEKAREVEEKEKEKERDDGNEMVLKKLFKVRKEKKRKDVEQKKEQSKKERSKRKAKKDEKKDKNKEKDKDKEKGK